MKSGFDREKYGRDTGKVMTTGMLPLLFLLSALIFLSAARIPAFAREVGQAHVREVVVVLDCSKSMEDVDGQYMAFDFVKGLAASVPRDCRVGVVTYNDVVCDILPLGSSHAVLEDVLGNTEYRRYGNAGAGLEAAAGMFTDGTAEKRIILVSDGEIMMDTEEGTQEAVRTFRQAVEHAAENGIPIDVLALGETLEQGHTVYYAAGSTGGKLQELADARELSGFIEEYLFGEWGVGQRHVGKLNGTKGELTVTLPDCFMETAKILLLGEQQNENMTINGEADRINVSKGMNYTVIELFHPKTETVKIQTSSEEPMDMDAYLTAEYDYSIAAEHTYMQETGTARILLSVTTPEGKNLLDGHLRDGGLEIYLNGEKQDYTVTDGRACMEKAYSHDGTAGLEVGFKAPYASYYGEKKTEEKITVPVVVEEPEPVDWFFWSVITVFVLAISVLFFVAWKRRKTSGRRRRIIEDVRIPPKENGRRGSDFCGKIVVYVIHSKDDTDYPPESINLFARCNREMITLEWILDTCNLPLELKGAERIIFRPGDDRSLAIKNGSKASALMGRELLAKGRTYHMYFHEKVTFIFEQEDTEIEVHYKDLKPSER